MKLLVFTAGFYDRDYEEKIKRLSASCKKFEIDLMVYGRGEIFSFFDSKIRKMGMFLNRFKNEYTHVLYTDAADTFFLDDLGEVISKYTSMGSPALLLSAEKGCYPFPDLCSHFPDTVGSYRFFNAGGFLGEVQYVLDIISKLKSYHYVNDNDNAHWMLAYTDRKIDFTIDHTCEIFQTMSDVTFGKDVDLIDVEGKVKVFNNETGSYPSVIHFNGPKQQGTPNYELMEDIFKRTW